MRPVIRILRTHPKKFTQYDAYLNSIRKKSFRSNSKFDINFNSTEQECKLTVNLRSVHDIPRNDIDIPDYVWTAPMYMALITFIIGISQENPYDDKKYYY